MTTTIPASAAQTPVHTVADILRAIAQDPEIAVAVRQHVLTDELLNLPSIVALMSQQMDRNTEMIAQILGIQRQQTQDIADIKAVLERHDADIADIKAILERHDADIADLKAGQERHDADIAEIKAILARHEVMLAELKAGQERHDSDIAEIKAVLARHDVMLADLKAGQERHDADIADIKASQRRVEIELGELRAKATSTDAVKMMGLICEVANLRQPRWLERHDIFALIDNADTTGIPSNELRSCHRTDLVMRAVGKDDGAAHYAIVECSATITGADIRRIRRNADHFARITGCVTHAVAVGKLPPPHLQADASRRQVHCLEPTSSVTRPD